MRWLPVEAWRWETPLTVPEIRERLAGCSRGAGGMFAQRKTDFAGNVRK